MPSCPTCKAVLYRPRSNPDFYSNKLQCLNGHIWELVENELVRHPIFKGKELGPVKGGGKRARSGKKVKGHGAEPKEAYDTDPAA